MKSTNYIKKAVKIIRKLDHNFNHFDYTELFGEGLYIKYSEILFSDISEWTLLEIGIRPIGSSDVYALTNENDKIEVYKVIGGDCEKCTRVSIGTFDKHFNKMIDYINRYIPDKYDNYGELITA